LEDQGKYELAQDAAGRKVRFFKGRRDGYMPEYRDHPVKDFDSWERDVKWRLDTQTPERTARALASSARAKLAAGQGRVIVFNVVGGYMYLRSLMGPEGVLYMVYDEPELVHACMEAWFTLIDWLAETYQKEVVIDELFLGEDICYNHGPLISPDMMREFLFPYYQQLIANIKRRSLEPDRRLHFQVDSDGDCRPVIPLYMELGADYFSPFEAASGCDVVEIRRQYPQLLMRGGIDKRILAMGRDAIDRELERVIPFMREQGGYIPTCDHGVPEEVSFENYAHFRERLKELGTG
jgi:uroporphyrinogen decarboxylase